MDEMEKKKVHKIYEEVQLKDDFIFKKCMNDPLILEYLLKRIFGKDHVGRIVYIDENHEFHTIRKGHKVVCDLYAIDDVGRNFVIENQNYRVKGFLNRLEYASQISGVNLYTKKKYPNRDGSYSVFPQIYCVWICSKNPFGLKIGMMEFTKQANGVPYSLFDIQRQVVISRDCIDKINDEFLKYFLKLMEETTSENALLSNNRMLQLLYSRYEWFKQDEETKGEYMLSFEDQAHYRSEGEKIGFKKGIKQGLKQGVKQGVKQGIAQGVEETQIRMIMGMVTENLPLSQIATIANISTDEVQRIIEEHSFA